MEQNIEYKGMTSQPSDYACGDGEMKLAVNAEYRDGGYHAVRVPNLVESSEDSMLQLFVFRHTQTDEKTIIYLANTEGGYTLNAQKISGETVDIKNNVFISDEASVGNFCQFGNIFAFTLDDKLMYAFYRDGAFVVMDRLPTFPNLYFAAARNDVIKNRTDSRYGLFRKLNGVGSLVQVSSNTSEYFVPNVINDADSKGNDVVFAALNSIIEKSKRQGRLNFPCLLRYALRLYDGTNIQISPPILLFPIENCVDLNGDSSSFDDNPDPEGVYWGLCPPDKFKYSALEVSGMVLFYNQYKICFSLNDATKNAIKEYARYPGIVVGLDVYISHQIYTINTDVAVTRFKNESGQWFPGFINSGQFDEIEGISTFYKVKSFSLDEMNKWPKGKYIDLLEQKDYYRLSAIEQQEQLTESTYSNSDIYVGGCNTYNSRINVYNIRKCHPSMMDMNIMCPPILGLKDKNAFNVNFWQNGTDDWTENYDKFVPSNYERHDYSVRPDDFPVDMYQEYDETLRKGLYLCLRKNDIRGVNPESLEYSMHINNSDGTNTDLYKSDLDCIYLPLYFSYPASGADRLSFRSAYSIDGDKRYVLSDSIYLHDNNSLNQSGYFYKHAKLLRDSLTDNMNESNLIKYDSHTYVHYSSLVKSSDVNNPFVFPDENSAKCGSGKVIALANNSRAISQGQFGQFPLYAFCTDGVYSIDIGSNGTLQSVSPLSYDIICNAKSVANMENEVVFISDQGVLSINGGERKLLLPTEQENKYAYDACSARHDQKTFVESTIKSYSGVVPNMVSSYKFLTDGARMVYDYTHGRLIVYNPQYDYSYLIDVTSGMTSVLYKSFYSNLIGYDQCLMIVRGKGEDNQYTYDLYDYSSDNVVEEQKAYLITRPFKLGQPDVHKSVQSIIQRGVFGDKGDVKQCLYGSNDLRNWVPVKSSNSIYMRGMRGTGYKYYRQILFVPEFKQDEVLHGASVTYEQRLTNKMR